MLQKRKKQFTELYKAFTLKANIPKIRALDNSYCCYKNSFLFLSHMLAQPSWFKYVSTHKSRMHHIKTYPIVFDNLPVIESFVGTKRMTFFSVNLYPLTV